MIDQNKVIEMANNILAIKLEIEKLQLLGGDINCIEKNLVRINACIKMLELNVNDVAELYQG